MRLLHTKDFTFKEFIGENIPPYAIISHRWSEEEVSHQDFLASEKSPLQQQSESYGWLKIAKGCAIALRDEYQWMWIDTCCIDKKSSAELSEAINSMFAWYRDSQTCYVFLPDVPAIDRFDPGNGKAAFSVQQFKCSSWFSRAWTLQELIAPDEVVFFNSDFQQIGNKFGLRDSVKEATGIKVPHRSSIQNCSIGERMRWASKRQATRVEDLAYSLLGIFGINMPLLYGEGNKAFYRLQLEIIRQSDDESIFAWQDSNSHDFVPNRGLLAQDASDFSEALDSERYLFIAREHHEVTNKGIRIICNFPNEFLFRRLKPESIIDRFGVRVGRMEHSSMIMPLNIFETKSRTGRGGSHEYLVALLRVDVVPHLSQSRNVKQPVKYFSGRRDALILAECHTKMLSEAKRVAAAGFKSSGDRGWDVFCGEDDDAHTAIPVYFSFQKEWWL